MIDELATHFHGLLDTKSPGKQRDRRFDFKKLESHVTEKSAQKLVLQQPA